MSLARSDLGTPAILPRAPRLANRVDLASVISLTTVATAIYLLAILTKVAPPHGLSVSMFTAAPLAGLVALSIIGFCGHLFGDAMLRGYAAGLIVAVAAMGLQVLSFPLVSADGGPLRTSGDSNAALYLLFHLAPALTAVLGSLVAGVRWHPWAVGIGLALTVLISFDLVPLPYLLEPGGAYTRTLVVAEWLTTAAVLSSAVVWARVVGRRTSTLHAWILVSLFLSAFDLIFNALGGARFTPVWWASLSMRSATYLLLAGACLVWLLLEMRSTETYTETELSRREGQLGVAFGLTRRLLTVSERLSVAVSLDDVRETLVGLARDGTGVTAAALYVPAEGVEPPPALASMLAVGARHSPRTPVLADDRAAIEVALPGTHLPPEVEAAALVPIRLDRRTTAQLVLWSHLEHRWTQEDHQFLAGLANQGGQALQRATSYEAMATAATTLQESLLPGDLPTMDDLELLSAYRPLTEGTQVGGDWYDCVRVGESQVALIIGDVMGKGLRAAAVMGQVRVAMRMAISYDPSPSAVLASLDSGVLDLGDFEIVTLLYALLDVQTGRLGVARAGHPPLLIAHADGTFEALDDGGSAPVGAPASERVEVWVDLQPGSALVLYTDGLVESRDAALDVGINRTGRTVAAIQSRAGGRGDWQTWLDSVQDQSGWQDDVAVLIALYR